MYDYHTPVLLKETIEYLNIQPGKWYIDATLGGGGHTQAILETGGKVIAFDQDQDSINEVSQKLKSYIEKGTLILIQSNFTHLKEEIDHLRNVIPAKAGIQANNNMDPGSVSGMTAQQNPRGTRGTLDTRGTSIHGILFDLGVSSHQLDIADRGFSFAKDAPLDMRMNQTFGATAADLVNGLYEKELIEIFTKYGEEKFAHRIAKKIVESRKIHPIQTTKQLADLVKFATPRSDEKIHPATRVFQSLRIAVNDELTAIQTTLPQALELLYAKVLKVPKVSRGTSLRGAHSEAISNNHGRLVVISFHSLEDRIVKTTFKDFEEKQLAQILTPKPVEPSLDEIYDNPRARSSKLRAVKII